MTMITKPDCCLAMRAFCKYDGCFPHAVFQEQGIFIAGCDGTLDGRGFEDDEITPFVDFVMQFCPWCGERLAKPEGAER